MSKQFSKQNNKYNKNNNTKMQKRDNNYISAPIARTKLVKITRPRFGNRAPNGSITVSHKEFIRDVSGSVDYSLTSTDINPGLPLSFPWLNVIAVGYETYKFLNLKFEFNTSKSATTSGSVMMAVDFDPDDSAPNNKTQLLTYNNAVRGPVWNNSQYICSSSDLRKFNEKFIRFGNLATGIEKKLYDTGVLYLSTAGMPDNTVIGELHVSYTVQLITPQFDLAAYSLATSAKAVATGTVTSTNWLGNAITATGGVPLNYTPGSLTVLVPGQYLFNLNITGTGLVGTVPNPVFNSTGNTITIQQYLASPTFIGILATVVVNNPTPITTPGLFTAGSASTSLLRISYYNNTLA